MTINILSDPYPSIGGAVFVTLGETMIRDTPVDNERLERTRQVGISLGGSEFTVAVLLARLGIPSSYVTRVPDNPYGWLLRNTAREHGVDTSHITWSDKTELMGRYLYEIGRTPRPGAAWYQRKYSAASQLAPGMVDWASALGNAWLFHTSGITFGLATHSGYECNYLLETFYEAIAQKPADCLVSVDFNYRSTLWSPEQCKEVMTPLLSEHCDVLVTSPEDMAFFYGIPCRSRKDADLHGFLGQVLTTFGLRVAAVTLRQAENQEQQRWESAALDSDGNYYRSAEARPFTVWDPLGGGDAWVAGFLYGLLTESDSSKALRKGVMVGDAATRLKQTLMYDLPILTRQDIQALLDADRSGGGRRVVR